MLPALVAAALSVQIDLTRLVELGEKALTPRVTCGIKIVSVIFTGAPGQQIHYDGVSYTIPARGRIQVLHNPRAKTFKIDGHELPVSGPQNQFAALQVRLPEPHVALGGAEQRSAPAPLQ